MWLPILIGKGLCNLMLDCYKICDSYLFRLKTPQPRFEYPSLYTFAWNINKILYLKHDVGSRHIYQTQIPNSE